jgi:hypothetical protein
VVQRTPTGPALWDEERSAFTLGETRAKRLNVPEFSQNRRGNGYPVLSDGHRDIVFHKPKRTSRDIEEHSFSDLQGGGRGFEPLNAHHHRQRSLVCDASVDG